MLLSDEHGRLDRDETPYSLWKKIITLLKKNFFDLFYFILIFLELYQGRLIYSLRVRDGARSVRMPSKSAFKIPYYDMKEIIIQVYVYIRERNELWWLMNCEQFLRGFREINPKIVY